MQQNNRRSHYRIRLEDALAAHARAMTFGGRRGIHDQNLIESAISRPYSGYYRPIASKAAALTESFARNHGFIDGNKRTTVYLVNLLIDRSGYQLARLRNEDLELALEEMILQCVRRQIDFDSIRSWSSARIQRRKR